MSNIQEFIRPYLLLVIKICVGVFGCIYLYQEFDKTIISVHFLEYIFKADDIWQNLILILCVFSFFNWFGEIYKWKILSKDISLLESSRQVLISHGLSIFTPNKVGEYGGKCMFYPLNESHKVIAATSIGHVCQFGATVIFGCIGLIFISRIPMFEFDHNYLWVLPLTLFGFLVVFVNKKLKYHILKIAKTIHKTSKLVLAKVFLCSVFRYVIFSHQFLFLLWALTIEIQYIDGLSIIFVTYLFSSVIPSFALADSLVKGSMAVTLFSFLGQPHHSVLVTVVLMWLFNTMIPAVLGYMLLFKWKPKFSTLNV